MLKGLGVPGWVGHGNNMSLPTESDVRSQEPPQQARRSSADPSSCRGKVSTKVSLRTSCSMFTPLQGFAWSCKVMELRPLNNNDQSPTVKTQSIDTQGPWSPTGPSSSAVQHGAGRPETFPRLRGASLRRSSAAQGACGARGTSARMVARVLRAPLARSQAESGPHALQSAHFVLYGPRRPRPLRAPAVPCASIRARGAVDKFARSQSQVRARRAGPRSRGPARVLAAAASPAARPPPRWRPRGDRGGPGGRGRPGLHGRPGGRAQDGAWTCGGCR